MSSRRSGKRSARPGVGPMLRGFMRARVVRVLPLAAIGLALASCGSQHSSVLYDAAATRQCLVDRPEYVPNAGSPSTKPQLLVADVHRTKRDERQGPVSIPRGTSVVGVAFIPARTSRHILVTLSFFPTEQSARRLHRTGMTLMGRRYRHPERIEQRHRNVVTTWSPISYDAELRSILFGCLRITRS